MNSKALFDKIQKHLLHLARKVQTSNKLNLTDDANFAEDLFCRVLNAMYDYKLKNANILRANVSTIDLVDEQRKLVIQVTSEQSVTSKFTNTKNNFIAEPHLARYQELILLFITPVTIPGNLLVEHKIESKRKIKALGLVQLLAEIKSARPKTKKAILEILEEELEDNIPPEKVKFNPSQIKTLHKPFERTDITIDRSKTTKELFKLAATGNCLVIGKPGIGKSYILDKLHSYCWDNDAISIFIPVNELFIGTDEEISGLLKTKFHWVDYLASYKGKKRCVLIFDAFDTAKEADLKNNILRLINIAIVQLPKWKVIVSVREYDAYKSTRLLELFSTNKTPDLSECKRYVIEPLDDTSIRKCLLSLPGAQTLYAQCTAKIKQVLRIPYFLKIFIEVTKGIKQSGLMRLKTIQTEEQLLDLFWQKKISASIHNTRKEQLLLLLVTQLYNAEKLSVDRSVILNESDTNVYEELMSEGILGTTGIYERNISFSHNILFDFAIARLLIPTDTDIFIQQIEGNTKKVFIFRPSYLYFLNRLWWEERDHYWELFTKIWKIQKAPFNIVHQAFFNSLTALSYSSLEDLQPLLALKQQANGGNLMYRFLNALRFVIKDNIRPQDFDLFFELAKNFAAEYAWLLGFYIDQSFKSDVADKVRCAESGINYLNGILKLRQTNPYSQSALDHSGAVWGIFNISKSVKYKPKKVSALILKVLEILREPEFPISYFQQLADHILLIGQSHPNLAAKIFKTIYLHNEPSEKETQLGSGVLIGMRSTRRQDYSFCYHRLEESFPNFMKEHPNCGIILAIDLINNLKIFSYGKAPATVNISHNGYASKFISDGSIGEWDHEYEEGEGKILKTMFDYLEDAVKQSLPIDNYLKLISKHSKKSFIWKNLIKFYTNNASRLYKYSYDLLQNEVFYLANETSYEAAELLKITLPLLSEQKSKSLEKRILGLSNSAVTKRMKLRFVDDTIHVLLSCFPPSMLQYKASKSLLAQMGTRENHPIVSTGVHVSRGIEDSLDSLKIDSTNLAKIELKKQLQDFKNKAISFENADKKIIPVKAANVLMAEIVELQTVDAKAVDPNLDHIKYELIIKAVKILARGWKTYSYKMRSKCYQIACEYLFDPATTKPNYEVGEENRSGRFYVPNERIEAAKAIMHLSNCDDLPAMGEALKKLISDNDSIVRSCAASALLFFIRNDKTEFWQITKERLKTEADDSACMHLLINVCNFQIIREEPEEIDSVLLISAETVKSRKRDTIYAKQFCELLIATINCNQSQVAKNIVKSGYLNKELMEGFVNKAFSWIKRPYEKKSFQLSPELLSYFISELSNIISAQVEQLKLGINQNKQIHDYFAVLDNIIQRIYFLIDAERKGKSAVPAIEYYFKFKPVLALLLERSYEIDGGLMVSHTGYYMIQTLEKFVAQDPNDILKMLSQLVELCSRTGFSGEKATLDITLRITEHYLSDYKSIILLDEYFHYLVKILQIYVESGWQEALELIWKLNEIL